MESQNVSWILDQLGGLLQLVLALTFLLLLCSPFETLGWYAGWTRSRAADEIPPPTDPETGGDGPFLVYLTGVAGFSGAFLARRERGFLDRLRARLPGLRVVDDVFPFSVNNNPLDGDRPLRALWNWLHQRRQRLPNNVFDVLIVIRNICQVLVSADPRYGPAYNGGVAREVARRLSAQGFPVGGEVTLLAYSGGAQIAVGMAPELRRLLGARIRVVSLGGVYTDDPGVASVLSITDLRGSRDWFVPAIGGLFYPGRWPWLASSVWNRWRRAGHFRILPCGPMLHVGRQDYFSRSARLADGRSFADACADQVAAAVLTGAALARRPPVG